MIWVTRWVMVLMILAALLAVAVTVSDSFALRVAALLPPI